MKRVDLEHIIRASATIADDTEIVVFGSQAILGQFPDAPEALLRSNEADVFPRNHPERWELIDGSIGELSPFHETFGYYAQGVAPEVAVLPADWESRLIAVSNANTLGATGLCLEIHDLVIAKLVAGREKDLEFAAVAASAGLIDRSVLEERLAATELDEPRRARVAASVASLTC